MLTYLKFFLHGLGIGIANVIPGVSGGTMALIFGIYERLIETANDGIAAGMLLLRGDLSGFQNGLKQLSWAFVGPLIVGIVAAPFLGAGLLSDLLASHPQVMRGLFFGLIVGSLPIPFLRISRRNLLTYALMTGATALAWLLSSIPTGTPVDPAGWMIFGAAALAISAMVLPGVSGAYLLLILGMYQATLDALDALDLGFLAIFGAGAAIGLAGFTVLLNWLLKTRHDATMAVLVGLMLGSLRALWPWMSAEAGVRMPLPGEPLGIVLGLALSGALVTGVLTWWELRGKASS